MANTVHSHQQEVLRLLIENRGTLFAYVLAMTRNLEIAEEVFQEVSLTVCENYESFTLDTNFRAWAREIARRRILAYYRVHMREQEIVSFVESKELEEAFVAAEHRAPIQQRTAALHECLGKVAPFVRYLIELRYAACLRLDQIADQVGRQPESIRKTIYRSRIALRRCIESQLAEDSCK